MTVECYLDNCPHHEMQHMPEGMAGPFCSLNRCAWDQGTMTEYLKAVQEKREHPESVLPVNTKEKK